MLELEIKNLTAAITRLADIMEAGTAPTETWDGPVIDLPAKVEVVEQPTPAPEAQSYAATRQVAQDLCLALVREDRDNKVTIADWLSANSAKTIKQLDDCFLDGFINFLEGLAK
jgi:hypothetical protein